MMQSAFLCPVLMYHKVGHLIQQPADRYLNVSASGFRQQMRLMARLGYHARNFGDIIEAMRAGQTLPRRCFAITFDDGYRCIYTEAAPILAQLNFPATVFVVSACVGDVNAWDRTRGNPLLPLMNWEELRELETRGWEIGGHTRTHGDLGALDEAAAAAEIREGKEEAEANMRHPLRTFCYPFGHWNDRTPDLARAAGFLGACTTQSGLARADADPYLLPRVKIHREGVVDFLFRLWIRPRLPKTSRPSRRLK